MHAFATYVETYIHDKVFVVKCITNFFLVIHNNVLNAPYESYSKAIELESLFCVHPLTSCRKDLIQAGWDV